MLPADERFQLYNRSRYQRNDRLKVELEFSAIQRPSEIGFDHQKFRGAVMHFGIKDFVARFPGKLRSVHGDVGVSKQTFRAVLRRGQRDSYRRGTEDFMAVDVQGLLKRSKNAFGDVHRVGKPIYLID